MKCFKIYIDGWMIETEVLWDMDKLINNGGWTTLRFVHANWWQKMEHLKIHADGWMIEDGMFRDLCKRINDGGRSALKFV